MEKVYENAMAVELAKRGLKVVQQYPIDVYYEEVLVGKYYADLMVNDKIPLELKAMENLAKEHEVQLVHYLTATRLDVGLLINFGSSVAVKRKYRVYKKPVNPDNPVNPANPDNPV